MRTSDFVPTQSQIVAITVAYDSEDVIADCLTSLLDQSVPDMRIIIVDNASDDRTVERINKVIYERELNIGIEIAGDTPVNRPLPRVLLIRAHDNRGFAAGCNIGLSAAKHRSAADLFWLLNPDCQAERNCAAAYLQMAAKKPDFGLMGGRTLFCDDGRIIQSDGGQMSKWTAVCRNLNQGQRADLAHSPEAGELTFISGANLVASRTFLDTVGPMPEEYFLYYEEVAWALKPTPLPLLTCPDAEVSHRGGTAAGSGTLGRAPSAFSNYFNYRNRLRLAVRHCPTALPGAYAYSILKIAQLTLKGAFNEAWGAFLGLHQLQPTKAIQQRLGPAATRIAMGR